MLHLFWNLSLKAEVIIFQKCVAFECASHLNSETEGKETLRELTDVMYAYKKLKEKRVSNSLLGIMLLEHCISMSKEIFKHMLLYLGLNFSKYTAPFEHKLLTGYNPLKKPDLEKIGKAEANSTQNDMNSFCNSFFRYFIPKGRICGLHKETFPKIVLSSGTRR